MKNNPQWFRIVVCGVGGQGVLLTSRILCEAARRAGLPVVSGEIRNMAQRGGAPWVELESDNTLRVRVQSETAELHDQIELESSWDYEYFLTSFIRIASKALGTQWTAR